MARCIRAAITNPSATKSAVISYNRCSDNQFIDDYQIKPGDSIRIWFVEDTFSSTFLPFLDFDSSEIWPLTPTASPTPTPTPLLSATPTPTVTETPGVTASETPTPTPTPTVTETPGITASETPTPTPTPTVTETPSVTASETPTPTPTITETPTNTPTVTPSTTQPCYCEENEIVVTSGSISAWNYIDCDGNLVNGNPIVAPNTVTVCACAGSVNVTSWSGSYSINFGVQCVGPTPTPTPTITETPTNTPTPTETSSSLPGFYLTLQEVGPDVVLSGTGAVNVSSLSSGGVAVRNFAFIDPSNGEYNVGNPGGAVEFFYGASLSSLPSFGSGLGYPAELDNGDLFGITTSGVIVPYPYTGEMLDGSATFTGTTLSALGVVDGTYIVQWGASGSSETITLEVISTGTTPTPTPTVTETPTPTPTETPGVTASETPTPTPTETLGVTPSETPTQTPSETPTNTPTPSVTPTIPVGFGYDLVALPYNFPSSGNSILNSQAPIQSGSTNPNVLDTNGRGFYFNSFDNTGTDRTDYFTGFTGQSVTITLTQGSSEVIYSGDTNSFKQWVYSGGTGFVFGTGIGVPPSGSPSGTAILVQSGTEWQIGLPVFVTISVNVPTPTPTESETPTPTPTGTPAETPTQTPTNTLTPTKTPTPTITPTPTNATLASCVNVLSYKQIGGGFSVNDPGYMQLPSGTPFSSATIEYRFNNIDSNGTNAWNIFGNLLSGDTILVESNDFGYNYISYQIVTPPVWNGLHWFIGQVSVLGTNTNSRAVFTLSSNVTFTTNSLCPTPTPTVS